LPYKFTAKEQDEETGLYYYGARYLDPKYSMWISTDPALGEYIPQAPINDEAKKANGNLPGQGGLFNQVNFHLYHYAGNNPVRYIDPDGRAGELAQNLNLLDVVKSSITSAGYNLAQYKNWAANASQADGQLPVGDLVGLGVVVGVGLYTGYNIANAYSEARNIVKSQVKSLSKEKNESKGVGSYTITFASGKSYHGKGSFERAKQSAIREGTINLDLPMAIDWTLSKDNREAFKDEYSRLSNDGSYRNPDNYNRIQSPGRKKYIEDYGRPHPADPDQSM